MRISFNGDMQKLSILLLPQNPNDPQKHSRIMEKLRATVLSLVNSDPKKPLSPDHIAFLERRLLQAFPFFRTPTHPTYASMIQRAILELNEEGWSKEESISEYILENYDDLPWAHKRYLSHHLNKLCEDGEILCISSKCYTIPGLISRPNSKKKHLRRKLNRKRVGCVMEDGNLAGVDLMNVNEDQVGFQEEEIQMFRQRRDKRRCRSLIFYEEEDEVGGLDVVGREDNMIRSGEMSVLDRQSEQLKPKGLVDEDHNAMLMGRKGLLDEQQALLIDLTVQKLPLGEQTEPQAPLLPLEHEEEVRTETLPLDLDMYSSDANLMLVPIESIEKLGPKVDSACDPLSNIEGDMLDNAVIKSSLKERDQTICAADLAIVPFECNTPKFALEKGVKPVLVKKEIIVCGLTADITKQPKRKQVYHQRQRSKPQQEKPPLSLDESLQASLALSGCPEVLEQEQLSKISPQRGHETKLTATSLESLMFINVPFVQDREAHTPSLLLSFEEGSVKHVLGKQKFHLEPSHSSCPQELMSKDEELNLPLHHVLKKSSKRRNLSMQLPSLNIQTKLPNSESPTKMIPRRDEDLNLTWAKREQQQPKMQMGPQGQKHCNHEADNASATGSDTMSSLHLEEERNNGREKHEDQEPLIADCTEERVHMEPQEQKHFEPVDDEHDDSEKNQRQDLGFPPKPEQMTIAKKSESSPTQHQIKQQNGSEMGSFNSEPILSTMMKDEVPPENDSCQSTEKQGKKAKRQGQGRPPKAKPATICLSAEPSSPVCIVETVNQQGESQCLVEKNWRGPGSPPEKEKPTKGTVIIEEAASTLDQLDNERSQEQKNDGQVGPPDDEPQGAAATRLVVSDNPPSQLDEPPIIESLLAEPSSQHPDEQLEEQRGKSQFQVGLKDLETPLAGFLEGTVAMTDQPSQQSKQVKIERRGRPRKYKVVTNDDAAASSNLHQLQLGFPEPSFSQQKKKQRKKDGRGRPRKEKEATNKDEAAPLTLHHRQQEEPSEPTTHCHFQKLNKQLKRDGRGRPRKQNRQTDPAISLLIQNQNQRPKKDGRGRPRKQNRITKEDADAPLDLHHQQQEGLPEPETYKHSQRKQSKHLKRDRRGKPRKHPFGMHHQRQEGSSGPAIHSTLVVSCTPCELDKNESQEHKDDAQINSPDFELAAIMGSAVMCLDNQPGEQQQRKRRGRGGAKKPEFAMLFSEFKTDQQDKKLKLSRRGRPLKSTPAKILADNESHQKEQEKGYRQLAREKQRYRYHRDEQPGKSRSEVHETPPGPEQVTTPLDDEIHQQLKEQKEHGQGRWLRSRLMTTPSDNQPHHQLEEQKFSHLAENHGSSKSEGRPPKENSAKTTLVRVPLSSKDHLRSRIKQQSQPEK